MTRPFCVVVFNAVLQEDEDEFEEVEVDVKYKTVKTLDWERVNANVAVWARDKDEVTDEEYHNFYKVCMPWYDLNRTSISPTVDLSCLCMLTFKCSILC